MGKIVLYTGGCRSGKSDHAQRFAESLPGRRVYIATCPKIQGDAELDQRIALHQQARENRGWSTVEESSALAETIANLNDSADVILVDCLSLWINNIMFVAGDNTPDESQIAKLAGEVLAACEKFDGTVIFVTNEVGAGVAPDNFLARRYRDLLGRCNQIIAAGADDVTLVASGIPMQIKKDGKNVFA